VTDVEIKPTRFGAPVAQELITAALDDLTQRYGSADANPIDPTEFDPPDGCFFLAWREGSAVACGGWRTLAVVGPQFPADVAEIKRLFTVASARNTGVATQLLRAVEDSAREAGMREIWLETGQRQPEAISFYKKHGYERVNDYGHYKDASGVVSLGRSL
jgi:GNAT superfamily N-acetyltransferase